MKWTSTKDSLPGSNKLVFVYCEHSGKIDGPVHLIEHKGTDIKKNSSFMQDCTTGKEFEIFESSGICAFGWFKDGIIFTKFMPTHWTDFPKLPKKTENET
jgi:hypothetical protein